MKDKKTYNQIIVIGDGEKCIKCDNKMERRRRKENHPDKTFFYTKWDYCKKCKHTQHYDEFKSENWKEHERQTDFFAGLQQM